MKLILFLVFASLTHVVFGQLGNVTVTFQTEDPATGNNADAIIVLGESLEVTITLSPPPILPIRFDIVSSLPDIIKVSHSRITFNRGQTQGVITLESPPDGKIGISTIIVTPEKPGIYRPITFDILVQGFLFIEFLEDDPCVSVTIPTSVVVRVDPPAPESIAISLFADNGDLSESMPVIPLGHNSIIIEYTGTEVGSSQISARTDLYVSNSSLSFDTLGTIVTEHDSQLIEDTPSFVTVSVLPENPSTLPNIFVSGSNAIVTPTSFTLEADGTSIVEVIPEFAGSAKVTYKANGYCPHEDIFPVAEKLLCSSGFVPNIIGNLCVPCPGHLSDSPSIDCNDEGTCSYSKCFEDSAVCFCFFPFIGSACQFDTSNNNGLFDQHILNGDKFRLSLDNLAFTDGPTKFLAPGNLINETFQPGRAIVAGYYPDNLFYNAVNPALNPPMSSFFSGIGWYWENSCDENALIKEAFLTAPVSVRLPFIAEAFSNSEILQAELYLYNETTSEWVPSFDVCTQAGFNSTFFVDFYEMTITTSFCAPGQYAIFVVPNSPPVPNTGNSDPLFVPLEDHSGTSPGTGKTGWQPAPPVPLPVPDNFDAYRPSLKVSTTNNSSSLSISVFIVAVLLCLAI